MNILCPNCHKVLYKVANTYKCENKHSFDIAKEGYLNLNLHNSNNTGDEVNMIKARQSFLNKGYYSFLKDKVNELIDEEDSLVDLACGEGYYTACFKAKDKIGIDLSKQGLKIASKADKTSTYLLNSIFHNPLEDNSADKIITIFAPIAKEEIVRILKPQGKFILVKPDTDHLIELKKAVYDNPYLNEVAPIEITGLHLEKEINIQKQTNVKKEDILNLFKMTPYYHKTSLSDINKLDSLDSLDITFAFVIAIYNKD